MPRPSNEPGLAASLRLAGISFGIVMDGMGTAALIGLDASIDAAEDLSLGGSALECARRGKVGGVGHNVHLGFAVGAMTGGAVPNEHQLAARDGGRRIGNRALELLRVSGTHPVIGRTRYRERQ